MTTTASERRQGGWLVLLLAAVLALATTALLGAATGAGVASATTMSKTGNTSASASSAAETRVGASTTAAVLAVGAGERIAAGQRRGNLSSQPYLTSGHCVAAEDGASALSYSTKITNQLGPRGWTTQSVESTVRNPAATHDVWDFTSGVKQPATAYVTSNGGYVVVNDGTGQVVQVSDLNNPNWKPVWNDPRFKR